MTAWKEVDEDRYDEMLGVLWPAYWSGPGFLVGEAFSLRKCAVTGEVKATYSAFNQMDGKFFEGPDMTVPEFKEFLKNVHGKEFAEWSTEQ